LQAPGDPGSAKRYFPFATPAVARDWMVDDPMSWKLSARKSSPKPSISF